MFATPQTHKNKLIQIFRYILLVIFIISLIFFFPIAEWLVNLSQKISPDGEITPDTIFTIKFGFATALLFLAIAFVLSFPLVFQKVRSIVVRYFNFKFFSKIFLSDPICAKKEFPLYMLVLSTLIGLIFFYVTLFFGEPKQEGPIEMASSFLFLISGLLLLSGLFLIRSIPLKKSIKTKAIALLFFSGVILLLAFGEEISWGQHFFEWESPEVFEAYNYQDETNLHNFFNPIFKLAYPTVGILFFVVLMIFWFFLNKKPYLFHLFIPHPNLFFLALVISKRGNIKFHESFEQLVALFILMYAIRIFVCLLYPDRKNIPLSQSDQKEN